LDITIYSNDISSKNPTTPQENIFPIYAVQATRLHNATNEKFEEVEEGGGEGRRNRIVR
jgi:hypothetical protein